jgi:hypothetical protein
MDFIERLFGISPDGVDGPQWKGKFSGSTEMYIAVFVLIVAAAAWRRLSRRSLSKTRSS